MANPRGLLFVRRSQEFAIQTVVNVKVITAQKTLYIRVNYKEILEYNGFAEGQTGSPRQILKTAYHAGLIKDEELWLKALVARNNVAHAYNQAVALDIVEQTRELFYPMFLKLKEGIELNWRV